MPSRAPSEIRAVLESCQRALDTRDPQDLLDVLAPAVVLVGDGGGIKRAGLRPVAGAGKVVRFYLGGSGEVEGTITGHPTLVNGGPALLVRLDDEIDGIMAIRVEDARIIRLHYVRNPAPSSPTIPFQ
ncbi:hypothetical protein [Streptomyces sp. NPDC006446]|uniref:hypothetical protein n=1 Tax=Streptomyces sp. NPDC006446 TaxID=3154301 RepID=UPI0033B5A33A